MCLPSVISVHISPFLPALCLSVCMCVKYKKSIASRYFVCASCLESSAHMLRSKESYKQLSRGSFSRTEKEGNGGSVAELTYFCLVHFFYSSCSFSHIHAESMRFPLETHRHYNPKRE